MRLSTITAAASLLAASSAAAIHNKRDFDLDTVKNAVFAWQANTAAVSQFLDQAATQIQFVQDGTLSSIDLTGQASLALSHENDELNQKGILESALCIDSSCAQDVNGRPDISTAKSALEGGAFGNVVNLLGVISNGDGLSGPSSGADVDGINFGSAIVGGRCGVVLPAIDAYFVEASDAIVNAFGDTSLVGVTSVRPQACNGV
ncbi:hypothetical protein LTR10_006169 [Elasticomyces elasticus]|nr:hypothetical protein LTR10_006169 [Elasticomyces elasticus]KAK4966781.1 hypothetical protein LTR42_011092 [Elasticomyces elasticus]